MKFLLLVLIWCTAPAAQALTQEQVMGGAERLYRQRMAQFGHALDADPVFLGRVQRIAATLIGRARQDYPATAGWPWELHTTRDPDENAYGMAGGRLLVAQPYVAELGLSDPELAMMLAHEMLHAILQHNLQEYEEALRVEPVWRERPFEQLEDAVDNDSALMHKLAPLNYAQEIEADREGLKLVARAGWAPERAALYFKKAMRASSRPNVDSESHPSPAARWQAARELAARIGQDRSQAAPAGVTMDAKHTGTR